MKNKRVLGVVAMALLCAGCDPGKVKQQPVDDPSLFVDSGQSDMDAQPAGDLAPVIVSKAQRRQQCCQACDEALAKDRTGDAPEKIPCADFTADMTKDCVDYFVKKPLMASEAKACAAEPVPEPEE